MKLILLVVLLQASTFCFGQAWSGIISPSRAIDWSGVGASTLPNRTTTCSSLTPANTLTDINNAIANCPAGQVVLLAAGTYNLAGGIIFNNKSNVTLRGAGPDRTFLIFTGGNSCGGSVWGGDICITNGDNNDGFDGPLNTGTWTAGYSVGSTSVTVGSVTKGSISHLQVGSVIFLDQADDASDTGQVYICQTINICSMEAGSSNGRPGRGQQEPQIVTSISGTGPWTIGISPGIQMPNIVSSKSPGAWWSNNPPVSADGVENMSLDHTNTGSTIYGGIFILNGYQVWAKNIRDINSQHKHVWFYQTIYSTVRDSYFYGSWNAASESYGIDSYDGAYNLVENNMFQHIAIPMIHEGCIGCAEGYNFAIDDNYTSDPNWQQASSYHHSVGDAFILFEGNQGIGLTGDDVHGTSSFFTAFRNYWNGRDPAGGSTGGKTEQTNAVIMNAYNRYWNLIGNVLGTSGYHTRYQVNPISTTDPGNSNNTVVSIFAMGFSGNQGTYYSPIPNDMFLATALMRWGNYDVVTGSPRWNSSEVPSQLSPYGNPLPGSHNLPPSFYLSGRPAWWPTTWGTPSWPANGPDVSAGNIPNLGGYANNIPSQLCYANTPTDNNYGTKHVLLFNAANCYASYGTGAPAPPTNLTAIPQ